MKRDKVITVRVNDNELAALKLAAAASHRPIADFVRSAALGLLQGPDRVDAAAPIEIRLANKGGR